jgi:hypothetical protein
MNRILKTAIPAIAGALMLSGGAVSANAYYLGYANGDPGNWDFATEQAGGPCAHSSDSKCCLRYNPETACPIAHLEYPDEHPARRRH